MTARQWRMANEIPTVLMILVIIMVVIFMQAFCRENEATGPPRICLAGKSARLGCRK
jgi:hypothetical protein